MARYTIPVGPPTGRRSRDDPAEAQRAMLERNLDKLFNQYIRLRDKSHCVLSGGAQHTDISHFFGKSGCPALRWREENAHVMLKRLHRYYHEANPMPYYDYMIETYGEETFAELKRLAKKEKYYYTIDMLVRLTQEYGAKVLHLRALKAQRKAK